MSLPNKIEKAMKDAIANLAGVLRLEAIDAKTHRTLIVSGWDDNNSTIEAIACYLVGLSAGAIDAALNINAILLDDTSEQKVEILQNVIKKVGSSKEDERNPWISEGIWHLCMVIASRRKEFHPVGAIVGLNPAHVAAKDHGLDVAVIYDNGNVFGVSLIETKAYKNKPNEAIHNAVEFFKKIDKDKHAETIRQAVQIMRGVIAPNQQSKVSGSFWKRERAYLPNPHYDKTQEVNWKNTRPSFRDLEPDSSHIIIMPHIISGFDDFFDKIANEMLNFAKSL